MKRKYFLRGVGIGILITTFVFILMGKQSLSDEEVIKRAEELGYVKQEELPTPSIDIAGLLEKESTPVPTMIPTETVTPQPDKEPDVTIAPEPSEEPESSITPEPSITPDAVISPEPSESPSPSEIPDSSDVPELTPESDISSAPDQTPAPATGEEQEVVRVEFRVKYGTSAGKICDQLEEAGIIEDASEFRKYLASNEIDDTIRAGLYIVSSDMTYEELANILRRQEE